MEDTPRQVRDLVYRTVMARTEEERFLMCAEMFETSKELAKIGMPEGLSPKAEEEYVFRRLHGFSPHELVFNDR